MYGTPAPSSESQHPEAWPASTYGHLRGVPDNKKLLSGTLPDNKKLLSGTLLDNKKLLSGTLPDNNLCLKSKHGDLNYSCNQCDYQVTRKKSLKFHIKSKHEGVKYLFDQCDNQHTTNYALIFFKIHHKLYISMIKFDTKKWPPKSNEHR